MCYLPGIIGLTNLLTVPAFAALLIDLTTVFAWLLELVAPKLKLFTICPGLPVRAAPTLLTGADDASRIAPPTNESSESCHKLATAASIFLNKS
jgi:hypothetical protein